MRALLTASTYNIARVKFCASLFTGGMLGGSDRAFSMGPPLRDGANGRRAMA